MAPPGPAPAQGLRVRQAALHRLPPLRGPAPAVPGLPGDLPAGGRVDPLRPPAGRGQRRPSPSRTSTSARSSTPPRRPTWAPQLRRGRPRRAASRSTGARVGDGASSTPRTPRRTWPRPASCSRPPTWSLHHAEPFGPIDSVVVVDTESELLAAMNASNGSLVGSIATDDLDFAARVAEQLQSFKVGINKPRSRGDREEVFGGLGALLEGRLRRRRPAGAGRHLRPGRPRRTSVRQLPRLLPTPRTLKQPPLQTPIEGGSRI